MRTQQISAEDYLLNLDPRAMPRYLPREAACYLGMPTSTIVSWFYGMPFGKGEKRGWFAPLLVPASDDLLSFYDVASAHILLAMKQKGISQEDLRAIVNGLRLDPRFDNRYPLLGRNFFLFGGNKVKLVIKQRGKRIQFSRSGGPQYGIKEVMDRFLSRLDYDKNKMPLRLRPLRSISETGRGFIVLDPRIAGGRPVVKGTGIVAEIIAKRNKSGESVKVLAEDYRISERAVQEAIKYYPAAKAA